VDVNEEQLENTAAELARNQVEVSAHRVDVAIGVTAVYPLIVRTNIAKTTRTTESPLPARAGDPLAGKAHAPEQVARQIVRAIQRNRACALIGSGMHLLDLGKRLLPVAFDRILARYLEQ
jgi:short-subunit dehydrogenase